MGAGIEQHLAGGAKISVDVDNFDVTISDQFPITSSDITIRVLCKNWAVLTGH